MIAATADVHLKRAYGFVHEVEKATDEFRQHAIQHDAQVNTDEPFLQGMISTFRGSRRLGQEKASLLNDLALATQEVETAATLDGNATIDTGEGPFDAQRLRATIPYMRGQLEMICGTASSAKQFFNTSLQVAEFPEAHYMLGLLYESEYSPTEALQHFERCLELDPGGELSVPALRESNAMKNYKKRFRGSWGLFLALLIVFFPLAFVYFVIKRK